MADHAHPAPQRHEVGLPVLAFCLFAAPAVWGLRLLLNFGLNSYFCFPAGARRSELPDGLGWVWPTLLGLDLLTLAVAAVSAVIALRAWRATRHELHAAHAPLIELGEGRTRFLSLWGLIIGIGFFIAVLFDLVGLFVVPICG